MSLNQNEDAPGQISQAEIEIVERNTEIMSLLNQIGYSREMIKRKFSCPQNAEAARAPEYR
jgi:hypothetical protein